MNNRSINPIGFKLFTIQLVARYELFLSSFIFSIFLFGTHRLNFIFNEMDKTHSQHKIFGQISFPSSTEEENSRSICLNQFVK